jgi:hypothetical protein
MPALRTEVGHQGSGGGIGLPPVRGFRAWQVALGLRSPGHALQAAATASGLPLHQRGRTCTAPARRVSLSAGHPAMLRTGTLAASWHVLAVRSLFAPQRARAQLCVQADLRGGNSNEPSTVGRRPLNAALGARTNVCRSPCDRRRRGYL